MVKVSDLAKEIAKQVAIYTAEVEEEVQTIKDNVSKEAVEKLKQKSPVDTGSYAKGWARKKRGTDYIIHNKTDYQLTHLLEHGHAKVNGGRVAPKVHIRPVEEQITNEYVDKVKKAIKQ